MGESEPTGADNLGSRARTAAGWQFLSRGINTTLQMVTSIVLARLLMPEDFGIVAMAAMVTNLAAVFRDLGLGQALVQRQEISQKHTRSAFWGTLVMALLLYGIVYLAAPWVGVYFSEPRMVPVLKIIAIAFVLSPFAVVPRALLQRGLDFRTPFFAGLASSAAYGAVGITMALLGHGYWALVGASLAGSAVNTVALCILTRYLPPLVPTFRGIGDLYGFGVGVTGVGLFNAIAEQLDYLVIGRLLDAAALGLYTKAFNLIKLPLNTLSSTLYPVFFSSFSTIQDDDERAQHAYSRILTMLCTFGWPALAILLISAPELIPVVFGEQWTGAVQATRIMVLAGALKLIMNPSGAAAKARGARYAYSETWRQAVRAALTAGAAWYGARWGIEGVAWGINGVQVVWCGLMLHLVYQAIGFSLPMYLPALRGPAAITAFVLLSAWGARTLLTGAEAAAAATLGVTMAAGVVVGILMMLLIPWPELKMVRYEISSMSRRIRFRKAGS